MYALCFVLKMAGEKQIVLEFCVRNINPLLPLS
jgi:hypothetical protein